jgi:hypothetical protein
MADVKIRSLFDLANEANQMNNSSKANKASTTPKKDNNFDDVIELFKECGLDELLEEGE